MTIVVLENGKDISYPPEHEDFKETIIEKVCVLEAARSSGTNMTYSLLGIIGLRLRI